MEIIFFFRSLGIDGIDGPLPIVADDDNRKLLKRWESEGYTVSNPKKRIYVIDAKDITKPGNGGEYHFEQYTQNASTLFIHQATVGPNPLI